jgi:starch phosphorylase
VQVYLDDLDPETVSVELYANGLDASPPVRIEMPSLWQLAGADNACALHAQVATTRPATDYTMRLIPRLKDVAVPLQVAHILGQK